MKKFGFTLAEVLITLALIGVVAAVTLPSLMADTTAAQIGPKLAKAVAMFEQANEALLNENAVDSLSDGNLLVTTDAYGDSLSNHLKIAPVGDSRFLSKDGMIYFIDITNRQPLNSTDPAHMQRIGNVVIDINGNSNPNESATDIFFFSWWNDGSLRPQGATNWGGDGTWQEFCPEVGEDGSGFVTNPDFCAGHVFENNLRVLYRLF